jgi:lipopolysaccharide export system protein LptA
VIAACHRAGFALLIALGALPALAERADRERPVNIEADRLSIDDAKKESTFEGNVTLSQGTLVLKADRVIVRQDGEGFNYGIAYGKPAYFRQKREGFDEYVEGYAQRLEYDGRADRMQMFTEAQIRKGGDEVHGDYISYNAVTEYYQVIGGRSIATTANPKGRVTVTIQPKHKPATPGTPLPLKPAPAVRDRLEE